MKAGEIYILTEGEYSDFGVLTPIIALRDFDFDAVFADFCRESRAAYGDDFDAYSVEFDQLAGWLEERGYARRAPIRSLHVGAYGRPAEAPEATALKKTES